MAKTKEAKNHSRSTVWKQVKVNWQMYLFLLLPVIWLIIFKYVPMYGAQIAFRDYTIQGGFTGSKWVGLKHFNRFFTSYSFGNTLSNTLILSFYSLIVGFPLPIIFALLLNSVRSKRWKSVVENVTYMPNFISAVVMVGMLFRVMDVNSGLLANIYCALTGAKQLPFNAMASGWGFRHLYVWSGVWQGTGWGSIIYMAALSSVDPQLHEAAMIDGAGRFHHEHRLRQGVALTDRCEPAGQRSHHHLRLQGRPCKRQRQQLLIFNGNRFLQLHRQPGHDHGR